MLSAKEVKLLAFVSDRSAATIVTGAHQFLDNQSLENQTLTTNVSIRSVSQLNQLTNTEIQQLINQHHGLIIAGVFGESVERLLALTYKNDQTRWVLNTDRRLIVLHNDSQEGDIASLASKQLQVLMASVDKGNYFQALAIKQKQWPQFAAWIQARAYWQNKGKENLSELFRWLRINTLVNSRLNSKKLIDQAKPVLPLQSIRFYWQDQLIDETQLNKKIAENNKNIFLTIIPEL